MSMDGSPIIDRTPRAGLYLNCGWCYAVASKADAGLGLVLRPPDSARFLPTRSPATFASTDLPPAFFWTRKVTARSQTCTEYAEATHRCAYDVRSAANDR